ncbi:hypothetical protein D3C86_1836810 [compost metagenome]
MAQQRRGPVAVAGQAQHPVDQAARHARDQPLGQRGNHAERQHIERNLGRGVGGKALLEQVQQGIEIHAAGRSVNKQAPSVLATRPAATAFSPPPAVFRIVSRPILDRLIVDAHPHPCGAYIAISCSSV